MLKSIEREHPGGFPVHTGWRLAEPETDVDNNDQLYAAVRLAGSALLLAPDGTLQRLTPHQFEAVWEGD